MDTKENLIILRNIFYKCFFIGIIFLILAALIYLPCECYVANTYKTFLGISVNTYHIMWVFFVGIIKTILIFLFLVPALAIHWTVHNYKKNL